MTKRVLFLQCANAAQYPPILNAATLLADRGWQVTILSSPSADTVDLVFGNYPGVKHLATSLRRQNAVRPFEYLSYTLASIRRALISKPQFIYASDPIGALPALAAAKLSGAQIIYHEHDTPAPGSLRPWLGGLRSSVARSARLLVFPNAVRSSIAIGELGAPTDRIRIVWNLPKRSELPAIAPKPAAPIILYYHGSITPERLPETVIAAVQQLGGRVRIRFAGYEAPGAPGYIARLLNLSRFGDGQLAEYVGQIPLRADLLSEATRGHIGLSLMPKKTQDINMLHMTGASNKPFDYMAAGLPLLVSDLSEWRDMFVMPGFARACDPADPDSIATALSWFLDNAAECRAMAARSRAKIEADWNYDTAFAQVMDALNDG